MMCYKDRTYCGSPNCVNACGRQFTDADRKAARIWWGSEDFPLCISYFCGKPEEKDVVKLDTSNSVSTVQSESTGN